MNVPLSRTDFDILCPMHLLLEPDGVIAHAGPTLGKLISSGPMVGRPILDVFEIKKPQIVTDPEDLSKIAGKKLRLRMIEPPHTAFKGVLVGTAGSHGQMIVNLSFGISVLEAVRDFSLTNADFAPTDLALELMYLVEAKTAAMDATSRLNARLRGAKIAAEEQAFTDTLTGLSNRRALDSCLQRLLDDRKYFSVMQIDLDYFKAVNDTLGHAAGDHVLQIVAKVMLDETRRGDMVARVGGDEFTIVLHGVQSEEVLERIGHRIITRLQEPIDFEGQFCNISASIGTVRVYADHHYNMRDLLSDADLALYASKHAGRATQTLYHPRLKLEGPKAPPLGRGQVPPNPSVGK